MSREIPLVRSVSHHDHRTPKDKPKPGALPADEIPPDHHQLPGEVDTITSAEKIRRNWEESQRSPGRQAPSHHHKSSRSSRDTPRHRSATSPPTAFRADQGFPWHSNSRGHDRSSRRERSRSRHRRDRSAEEVPRDVEIYENSDDSDHSSPRLEIHNATPIYEQDGMKPRGRPGLTSRFRSSLQRIGVGATRPARHRADISHSPSTRSNSRSPSPSTWRKPSPHSSLRAPEQFGTPRAAGFPDPLPRIESQRMTLDWGDPLDNNDAQSPPRPPDDAIPTIPDLNTPGIYHDNRPRNVPIIDGDRMRSVEIHEHPPSHRVERSEATGTTAVNPPSQRSHYQDGLGDDIILRNVNDFHGLPEGRDNASGRLKRLLSLNGKSTPADDSHPVSGTSPTPARPKVYSTTSGIIRSASLIRTRSRRKEVPKTHEQRVDPDVRVDYGSLIYLFSFAPF